jgi:hypothetical protein
MGKPCTCTGRDEQGPKSPAELPEGAGLVKTPAPEMRTPWGKSGKQVANELFYAIKESA